MERTTITLLNQLNQKFYQTTAKDFDESRQYFWEGWEKILPFFDTLHLESKNKVRVADIGCGNGRFGEFIFKKCPHITVSYTGIDGNETLLDYAQETLEGKIPALHLQKENFLEAIQNNTDFLGENKFFMIVSFGVFHHIPSYELRVKTILYLLSKLEKDGYLILSFWQFMEFQRFQNKVVTEHPYNLEKNDFILDWKRGEQALRYCHYYDEAEQKNILKDTKATCIKTYRADGKEGNVNQYMVLQQSI